ncbi:MAG: 2-C-methyl-D-erythritol 4-phosphate cytidylyltransferase, partial [Kordiimonadaceae bacterium]|nr:2-C-methyl-D-erythritol 4-phosphate cytidylyltransferase [Kordiimonadaceae bacterium]
MTEVTSKIQTKNALSQKAAIAVIVVAAGRGSRAETSLPKQYALVAGKTVLAHTIRALTIALPSCIIKVVIHPDDVALYEETRSSLGNNGDTISHTLGGATRQDSVYAGLAALADTPPDYVLVHDAARPFVSEKLISNLLTTLNTGAKAVIPALPVTDTLKRASGAIISDTVSRENLYRVQTPQAFSFTDLIAAHKNAPHQNFTDDAAIFEHSGGQVQICTGSEANFKITCPDDFTKAEAQIMMTHADVRVGSGYDVHR